MFRFKNWIYYGIKKMNNKIMTLIKNNNYPCNKTHK